MYSLETTCCLCLEESNATLKDLRSMEGQSLSHFDKISWSLTQIANVMERNLDYKICKKCSEMVDMIHNFSESCLKNIKILSSYKITTKEKEINVRKKKCYSGVKLDSAQCTKNNESNIIDVKIEPEIDDEIDGEPNMVFENVEVKAEIEDFSLFYENINTDVTNNIDFKVEIDKEDLEKEYNKTDENVLEFHARNPVAKRTIINYESDSEMDIDARQKPKKKRSNIIWEKECIFQDQSTVMEIIASENCWSKLTKYTDAHGNIVVRYRCNKVKLRGDQCAAAVRVIYNSSNSDIYLFRSNSGHNHTAISTGKGKITDEVKREIRNIYNLDDTIKPARILQKLSEKNIPIPTKMQLSNYLAFLRKQKRSI